MQKDIRSQLNRRMDEVSLFNKKIKWLRTVIERREIGEELADEGVIFGLYKKKYSVDIETGRVTFGEGEAGE